MKTHGVHKRIWYCYFLAFGVAMLSIGVYGQTNKGASKTSIYLTANTADLLGQNEVLTSMLNESKESNADQLLMALGNTVIQKKGEDTFSKTSLDKQLGFFDAFDGQVFVIPGDKEWDSNKHGALKDIEKYVQKQSKVKFYPNKGCPIKKIELSNTVVLIAIDSQWFLEDWNTHPGINNDCEINSRTLFFQKFEDYLRKAEGKTKIVAMHHPVISNTSRGFFSKVTGISKQNIENEQYRILRKRLTTLSRQANDVIFVSGHDENLQYVTTKGIKQIISGSAQKTIKARSKGTDDFSVAKKGYVRLDIDSSGKVTALFYVVDKGVSTLTHSKVIISESSKQDDTLVLDPNQQFENTKEASVYSVEETSKSKLYKGLWGAHYREFYSKKIEAPVVQLDTLYGGLIPSKRGGGHQTTSLRLRDAEGNGYSMRALRKSGILFLQSIAFQQSYILDKLKGSFVDRFVMDFYTTTHPYTVFTIPDLAESVSVLHTNPKLFYVPKQNALKGFNDEYGNELYMIEEHVGSDQVSNPAFGKPDAIRSTADVFDELISTGISRVDEASYVRSRIFDMLIGDWDRHADQWRWAEFNKDGKKVYKAIPRDRDQAFAVYDGSILSFLTYAVPDLRKMQSFDDKLRNPKWFNFETYYLDLAFINKLGWEEWKREANFIKDELTDEIIEKAFENIPPKARGEKTDEIKAKLKARRQNIVEISKEYYTYFNKFDVIIGSKKADVFEITRARDGKTQIKVSNKDGEIINKTFTKNETKEVWLYGLDGKDTFKSTGKGNKKVRIKIIGGEKKDRYALENGTSIKVYDFKSEDNIVENKRTRTRFVNDYEINNYDHKKVRNTVNRFFPLLSYNPDDGVGIGFQNTYSVHGLLNETPIQEHGFRGIFSTATRGISLEYSLEVANVARNWSFGLDAWYTSPNFAINFFGFGNETEFDRDEVDFDFNRVRIEKRGFAPSIIWTGRDGGSFYVNGSLETFEVENIEDRFIGTLADDDPVFERQTYLGGEVNYQYVNKNNPSFPSLGFEFNITSGYKRYVGGNSSIDNEFGYFDSSVGFDYGLVTSGDLVLATEIGGRAMLGNNFEFYHGSKLGGSNSLRGFRQERFNGKHSFYQSTELRYRVGKFRTSFIPLKYGFTAAFDYGRVWLNVDDSRRWNNNFGGSFWVNGLELFTTNIGFYNSDDGGRFLVVFGFSF